MSTTAIQLWALSFTAGSVSSGASSEMWFCSCHCLTIGVLGDKFFVHRNVLIAAAMIQATQ